MNFETMALIKVVRIYVIRGMNQPIHDIKSNFSQNLFILHLKC
jgi:hypothetical protein